MSSGSSNPGSSGSGSSGPGSSGSGSSGPAATSPPKVVAIGGGHGLAATLRALRLAGVAPTAVVAVADDGGSTGRLREGSDRVAMGDIRRCLLALAGESTPLTRAMEHRFSGGELGGHAFGNLLIAAMEETEGSLVGALDEISKLTGTVGRVLPVTDAYVELVAELCDGTQVRGQVAIANSADIATVRLEPEAKPIGAAIEAIEAADAVLLGPGSLFTSVLAAAVMPGVSEALGRCPGKVTYIANLRPQITETADFTLADHVLALIRHGIFVDTVLYDPGWIGDTSGLAASIGNDAPLPETVAATVGDDRGLVHDELRLAAALSDLLDRVPPEAC